LIYARSVDWGVLLFYNTPTSVALFD
jgi:hypothetical protein